MGNAAGTPIDGERLDPPDEAPVVPADGLAIIDAQRAVVRQKAEVDDRLILLTWGVAWLVGYLALYLTAKESGSPAVWAFAVFAGLLAAAVVATIVHTVRRTAGLAGPGSTSGAMFGLSWSIGFTGLALIMVGLMRAGISDVVASLLWNALPCLLVGVLYLAGGALWRSGILYGLGAWIVLVGGGATIAGLPAMYLVMAVAGGGGLLVGAALAHLRRNSGRGRPGRPGERGGRALRSAT